MLAKNVNVTTNPHADDGFPELQLLSLGQIVRETAPLQFKQSMTRPILDSRSARLVRKARFFCRKEDTSRFAHVRKKRNRGAGNKGRGGNEAHCHQALNSTPPSLPMGPRLWRPIP